MVAMEQIMIYMKEYFFYQFEFMNKITTFEISYC